MNVVCDNNGQVSMSALISAVNSKADQAFLTENFSLPLYSSLVNYAYGNLLSTDRKQPIVCVNQIGTNDISPSVDDGTNWNNALPIYYVDDPDDSYGVPIAKSTLIVDGTNNNIYVADVLLLPSQTINDGDVTPFVKTNTLSATEIETLIENYLVNAAFLDTTQTFTKMQKESFTVITELVIDLSSTNNWECTLSSNSTLSFTNIPGSRGARGVIIIDNTGGHIVLKGINVLTDDSFLTTISTPGLYKVSYISTGSSVILSTTDALS